MLDKVIEIDHEFCSQYETIVVYKLRHFSRDTNWCHSLVVECLAHRFYYILRDLATNLSHHVNGL